MAGAYTLLLCASTDTINATLYDRLNFNFIRDITPVAGISRGPNVLVVHPSFPAKTVPEFIAHAKANPGKVSFASAGVGSVSHVSGELFKATAGIDMVHVPYATIAKAAHCTEDTVRRAIAMLEKARILTWCNRLARVRIGGVVKVIRTSNSYRFIDPSSNTELRHGTQIQELPSSVRTAEIRPLDPNSPLQQALERLGKAVKGLSEAEGAMRPAI